jgi:hypothetical protein
VADLTWGCPRVTTVQTKCIVREIYVPFPTLRPSITPRGFSSSNLSPLLVEPLYRLHRCRPAISLFLPSFIHRPSLNTPFPRSIADVAFESFKPGPAHFILLQFRYTLCKHIAGQFSIIPSHFLPFLPPSWSIPHLLPLSCIDRRF